MWPLESRYMPDAVSQGIRSAYRTLLEYNYRLEAIPTEHTVRGENFYTYHLLDVWKLIEEGDPLLNEMLERCGKGEVVYDIGANMGYYSLTLLSQSRDIEIVAFEPNPFVYTKFQKNIELNGYSSRVYHYPFALSDKEESRELYVSESNWCQFGLHEYSSLKHGKSVENGRKLVETVEIDTHRLEDVVERHGLPAPDHIKIDVQGTGLEVLKGSSSLLESHAPTIYFEPHENEEGDYRREETEDFMSGLGYSIQEENYAWIMTA